MKPIFVTILVLFVSLPVLAQSGFDSSLYAIIPADTAKAWRICEGCKNAGLTASELLEIDSLLKKAVNAYNISETRYSDSLRQNSKGSKRRHRPSANLIDLSEYMRQLIVTVDSAGNKLVWVNCFCNSSNKMVFTNWKTDIVQVMDGGTCFFNLTINLFSKQVSVLSVNGVG